MAVSACAAADEGAALRCRDPKKAGPEALAWLTGYLQAFQDALEAPDWLMWVVGGRLQAARPAAGSPVPLGQRWQRWHVPALASDAACLLPPGCSRSPSYTTFIDGPSWLDYFLLTELTKNPDGYRCVRTPLHACKRIPPGLLPHLHGPCRPALPSLLQRLCVPSQGPRPATGCGPHLGPERGLWPVLRVSHRGLGQAGRQRPRRARDGSALAACMHACMHGHQVLESGCTRHHKAGLL